MEKNKKLIIVIIMLVAFLYIIFSLNILLAGASNSDFCPVSGTLECPHKQQLDFLIAAIPLIASVGVITGALTYYLMAEKIEEKEHSLKTTTNVLLKFLNSEEKKLVNLLVENEGKILQAEATRLPGMSKLKSHRTVQRLSSKGVITIEKYGKTNVIKLEKSVKDVLLGG